MVSHHRDFPISLASLKTWFSNMQIFCMHAPFEIWMTCSCKCGLWRNGAFKYNCIGPWIKLWLSLQPENNTFLYTLFIYLFLYYTPHSKVLSVYCVTRIMLCSTQDGGPQLEWWRYPLWSQATLSLLLLLQSLPFYLPLTFVLLLDINFWFIARSK